MITIIVAIAENGVIGSGNSMPWHLPGDLKRFKELTMGHALIMGRKTWESLPVKPLKGRKNIVLTRADKDLADYPIVAGSPEEAIELAGDSEIFIIGGAEIYSIFLPICDRLSITRINASYKGDTIFPHFDESDWAITNRVDIQADERGTPSFSYITFDRKK